MGVCAGSDATNAIVRIRQLKNFIKYASREDVDQTAGINSELPLNLQVLLVVDLPLDYSLYARGDV